MRRRRPRGLKTRPTKCCVDAWHSPYMLGVFARGWPLMLSLVPDRGEFLAVGHQRGTFAGVGAIEAENLVIGAGDKGILRFVVGLVVLPDAYPLEPDDRRFIVFR